MMWSNELLPFVVNADIVEYDIAHGNTSVMQTFQLRDQALIDELNRLPKKERNVRVGLLQREDKVFAKNLENGFNAIVKEFILQNDLDPDVDVIAIRRDAIFVVNRHIKKSTVGKYAKFVRKDQYHAYLHLNGKTEILFRSPALVDAKHPRYDIDGFIRDDDERTKVIAKLEPGILSFIEELIEVMEGSNLDRRKIYQYMMDFCGCYKRKELDFEYYREFTREAKFRIRTYEGDSTADFISDDMIDDLNISYNYLNVVIPILQSIVK